MGDTGEVRVFGDNQAAADFAVDKWMEICAQSVESRGFFAVALSGGRTPIDFYTMLSAQGDRVPWDKIHVFLTDERFVPHSHKESNYRLIREYLLDHIGMPKGNIHPVQTEKTTLEHAAGKYEKDIRKFFNIQHDKIPEFDLIMLGIGEDGHTASLFPGAPSLKEKGSLTIPVIAEKAPHQRISLTLPVLRNARHIIFLVTGASKARAIKEIVGEGKSRLPAALARYGSKSVYLVMDEGAASLLSNTGTDRWKQPHR